MHLGHVADAEGANGAQHCEDRTQPPPVIAQPLGDVVHRTADPVALRIALAEMDGHGNLGILGDHAEERGHFHPEYGAGAAGRNRARYAHDVARADRSRQGRGNGLQRGDRAGVCHFVLLEALAQRILHRVAKAAELDEAYPEAEVDACANDENQHQRAPHNTVNGTVNRG